MNTAERPRFRNDLVAHPFHDGGQLFVEVTDPDSGQTYKFYEVEYALASAMNGRRDVGGLVAWAAEELGVQTSPDELATVIDTLGDLGYLASGTAAAKSTPALTPAPDVELGLAGVSEADVPAPGDAGAAVDIDLGMAGASPAAPPAPAPAPSSDMSLELGLAGKSEVPREAGAVSPSMDVELGLAGGVETPRAHEPTPPPAVIEATPAPSAEESFAGLMDAAAAAPAAAASDFDVPPTPPPAEVPLPNMNPRAASHFDDDDGPTNLPSPMPEFDDEDVSVDLSEHLSIGAEDVKEAVRASKVMNAVDVPADLMAELDGSPEPPVEPPPVELPEAVPAPVELPASPPNKPVSGRVSTRKKPDFTPAPKPPIEPPVAEPKPAEKRGTSPVLVVLLLLVMVGGAAAYYFLVYKKDDTTQTTPPKTTKGNTKDVKAGANKVKTGENKTPPSLPSATLTAGDPAKEDIVAMKAGPVLWSVEDGAAVAADDVLATIPGANAQIQKIKNAAHDQKRYKKRIVDWTADKEKANEAGKKTLDRKIARETKKIADRQATIDAAQAIIDAHTIKATASGTLELIAADRERVKEGQTVAAIAGEPSLVGEFTVAEGTTYTEEQTVQVASTAAGSAPVDCMVVEVEAGKVIVECDADSGLSVGDDVVLK